MGKGLFPFFSKKKKTDELPPNQLPKIRTKTVPGPQSLKLTESLKRYECPQITYVGDGFPVFFDRAQGANVWDSDGNRYLDLTSFFGVMGVGHSSKEVIDAVRRQAGKMIHGMGDVHPNEVKVALAQRLAEITPGNLSQTIFSSTGAEAVETALKTAVMHTKKPGVIAFTGAYHGLTYGTLHVTHRDDFRGPFLKQLGKHAHFAPFPDTRLHGNKAAEVSLKAVEAIVKKAKRSGGIGAVLVEPIQGRGGVQVPPSGFLKSLREFCDKNGVVLIADEVFTGFGRTGSLFAVEKSGVVPDLLCVGKGMGAGMPISACIGSAKVMHSWGTSTGDAIHTSTYLGHPLGCAAALAVIREIESKKLVDRSQRMGELFRRELHKLKFNHPMIGDVRGSGLMIGLEFVDPAAVPVKKGKGKGPSLSVPGTAKAGLFVREALKSGVILLGSGPDHNVVSITPPFVISEKEIMWSVKLFESILKKIA